MDDELKYELERIDRLFPNQKKLNLSQMLRCIGRGNRWFHTRIDENRLDELPQFNVPKLGRRKGRPNPQYEFNVRKIAEFNLR